MVMADLMRWHPWIQSSGTELNMRGALSSLKSKHCLEVEWIDSKDLILLKWTRDSIA